MTTAFERKFVWFGAVVLVTAGVVIYRPSLDIGFWTDDYSFLDLAGRLSFIEYLSFYFNPQSLGQWYRPFHGMLWWIVYTLTGKEPLGYHVAQVLIHLANTLLLCGLVARVSHRWRLAFIAALIFQTLPTYALAVNWPGVADPLAALFFLLAIWFWMDYLQSGRTFDYALTVTATIATLLSKEIGIALPFTLVLLDLWVVRKPARFPDFIKRYAGIFLLLPIYAALEFTVLTQGFFTVSMGYGLGIHILDAFVHHMRMLAFPWGLELPLGYAWGLIVLTFLLFATCRGETTVLFLAAVSVLLVLPVLPLPLALAEASRYLYLPLMASAIGVAGAVEFLLKQPRLNWLRWVAVLMLVVLAVRGSAAIAVDSVNFAGSARQVRLQFRPIFQLHPSVGLNTLFYFVNPPFPSPNISGLMFQRYGPNVQVYGTDRDRMPNLRSHQAAFVYYQDSQETWQEQPVEKDLKLVWIPALPVQYGSSISLETFELASANLKHGQSIVLILYWKNTGKIERDYKIFTHLVNADNRMVAGYDAEPRLGYSPTSHWKPAEKLADAAVIPIASDMPPGEYKLELGLYDAETMQRVAILDSNGEPMTDKILISPINVTE